ncbi:MAG: type I-B CRISPR-associated protein Cas8b/Csh1 [Salinibacter sp.]
MIQGIRQMGEIVRMNHAGQTATLQALTQDPPNGEQQPTYLAVIDVDPEAGLIRRQRHELDRATAERFLWMQLSKTRPRAPFIEATANNLKYLVSQTIPNLAPGVFDEEDTDPDRPGLAQLFGPFADLFRDFGPDAGLYRYLLALDQFRVAEESRELAPEQSDRLSVLSVGERGEMSVDWAELNQRSPKRRPEAVAKDLGKVLGLGGRDKLYSLAVGAQPVVDHPDYQAMLYDLLIESAFANANEGICHLCGRNAPIDPQLARLRFKTYITQKLNFASGIRKDGFYSNYALCQSCYTQLLVGESFFARHLTTALLGSPTYLIPEFAQPESMTEQALERSADQLTQTIGELNRTQELSDMVDRLGRRQPYLQVSLVLVEPVKAGIKVRETIPEVPPSRMERVAQAMNTAKDWGERHWGHPNQPWLGGLSALLRILPLRRSGGYPVVEPALRLAKQVFLGEPVRAQAQIGEFLSAAQAVHYRNAGFHLVSQECAQSGSNCPELHNHIIRTLVWRAMLMDLGIWQEEEERAMDDTDAVPEPYREIVNELQLGHPEQALFLLGVLVAKVAYQQGRVSEWRSKPILEKLGYHGMSPPRLQTFAVEIFDKLRQYRALNRECETIHGAARELLDRNLPQWPLSDRENVYYLLSGYAHETRRVIQLSANREEATNENEPE